MKLRCYDGGGLVALSGTRQLLDAPVTVSGTITRSSVRGKLGAGGQPPRIRTGEGSIRLRRP